MICKATLQSLPLNSPLGVPKKVQSVKRNKFSLRRCLYYRVTQLLFGTPGGKIDILIEFNCFLVFIEPLPGSLSMSELSEIANSFATIFPLIFIFTGTRTLDFGLGHPL